MEESLVSYLLASSGLAALVGTRVYWTRAPQNVAKPYAALQRVSGNRDYHMLGPSGLVESRVQIDCYAVTALTAEALARAVDAALSGWHADDIRGVFRDSMRDLPTDTGSGETAARVSLDYIIHHQEN
jgi:hypothetical protein